MPEGFISLHRRIMDHPYWGDPERFRAWVDLLFMAAWEDHDDLKRGEFVVSSRYLSGRWRWSRGRVRRFLESAESEGEIRVLDRPTNGSTNRPTNGSTYLIVKYDSYQLTRPTNGSTNRPTNGSKVNKTIRKKAYTSDFESAWNVHHRGSKSKSFEEYRKAVPTVIAHQELLRQLTAYVRLTIRPDFQGVHLQRWIKDQRWEEDLAANSKSTPRRLQRI